MKKLITIITLFSYLSCTSDKPIKSNNSLYQKEEGIKYTIKYDTLSKLQGGVFLVNVQCIKNNKIVAEDIIKFDCVYPILP